MSQPIENLKQLAEIPQKGTNGLLIDHDSDKAYLLKLPKVPKSYEIYKGFDKSKNWCDFYTYDPDLNEEGNKISDAKLRIFLYEIRDQV